MTKIEELKAKHLATLEAVRDVAAKAEAEARDFSDEEREQISTRMKEVDDLQTQIKNLDADADLRKRIEGLGPVEIKSDAAKSQVKGSIGTQFADHLEKSLAPYGGEISEHQNVRGLVSPLLLNGGMKTIVTGDSATSGGAFVTPQDLGLRDSGTFQRPLTLRDVITNGTTGTDTVEYVKVTGFTNAASPTPEATATGGASGLKPESAMTFSRESETVKTIAHWIPVTKRALSDAGQVRTIIDNFLRYGLEEAVEDQIVNGTGTSEDFTGLVKLADDDEIQDQAWATDLLTTTRKARTLVKTVGRDTPNAYLLHPADWERLDLTVDGEERYYFGGPMVLGTPRLWGLPVIESEAVPSGFGFVGNFRQCVLWDRERASVTVGTIDDQFVRNIVTILAELRAAFGCFRPKSIVRMDLTS